MNRRHVIAERLRLQAVTLSGHSGQFVRACVAVRELGAVDSSRTYWERRGLVTPVRVSMPVTGYDRARRGTYYPLRQVLQLIRPAGNRAHKHWSPADIRVLETYYGAEPIERTAARLGRTPTAVKLFADLSNRGPRALALRRDKLITTGTLAKIMRKSTATVKWWCDKCGLQPARLLPNGRRDRLFDLRQVRLWLMGHPHIVVNTDPAVLHQLGLGLDGFRVIDLKPHLSERAA